MINGKLRPLTVTKTSIASKLAQQAEEVQITLPEEYAEFAEVFLEEASQKMPPSRPYDHPILLDETFVPKIGKVYPLSPDEQKATNNFIEENLRTGKIRPSSSPQASSLFYVGKKDSGHRPCQDYRYINKHTIKDAYLLPLISDLIDMVKDATILTKFDIRSRYNNIRIKEGDQWKAAFITSKGLFEPTIMFFRLSNSPTTFQRFMNNSFKDMIAEGWLIIYMDDMFITAANKQENVKQTRRVLQRMKDLDLHLKLKTEEVQVWSKRSGLFRTHPPTRRNRHGPHQTIWNHRMADPCQSKGCSILFRIHQLLQKVHRKLLKYRLPAHQPYKEKPGMEMDGLLPNGIQPIKGRVLKTTSPIPP